MQSPELKKDENGVSIVCGDKTIILVDQLFQGVLVQPGTVKEHKDWAPHKGKFIIVELNEITDKLRLIPIGLISRQKQLMPPYGEEKAKPICWSTDALKPSLGVNNPIHFVCGFYNENGFYTAEGGCPNNQWIEGKPCVCDDIFTMAFYDVNRDIPIFYTLKGTAISVWNKFRKKFEYDQRNARNLARLRNQTSPCFVMAMECTDEGNFYKLKMGIEDRSADLAKDAVATAVIYYRDRLMELVANTEKVKFLVGTPSVPVLPANASKAKIAAPATAKATDTSASSSDAVSSSAPPSVMVHPAFVPSEVSAMADLAF